MLPKDGLKLLNDRDGNRMGVAYIQLMNGDDKDKALSLDGREVNGRTLRVAHLEDSEFMDAVDSFQPLDRRGGRGGGGGGVGRGFGDRDRGDRGDRGDREMRRTDDRGDHGGPRPGPGPGSNFL